MGINGHVCVIEQIWQDDKIGIADQTDHQQQMRGLVHGKLYLRYLADRWVRSLTEVVSDQGEA